MSDSIPTPTLSPWAAMLKIQNTYPSPEYHQDPNCRSILESDGWVYALNDDRDDHYWGIDAISPCGKYKYKEDADLDLGAFPEDCTWILSPA